MKQKTNKLPGIYQVELMPGKFILHILSCGETISITNPSLKQMDIVLKQFELNPLSKDDGTVFNRYYTQKIYGRN